MPNPIDEDPRSNEDLVGEIFRRLFMMRDFHEPVFRSALHDALLAIGRAAHLEAEARVRRVAERTGTRADDRRIAWNRRRGHDEDRDR